MPINAFLKFSNEAKGESRQENHPNEIEVQGWDWEVEAESSWTKGGGAAVGKPNPSKFNCETYYNRASPVVLKFICSGQAFDSVILTMCKSTGAAMAPSGPGMKQSYMKDFYRMTMKSAFITKVSQTASEDGNVVQKIELVFKEIKIDYHMQLDSGKLDAAIGFEWNVPSGYVG